MDASNGYPSWLYNACTVPVFKKSYFSVVYGFFCEGGLVKNFRIMVMESIFVHISQFIFAYLHALWINVD